MDPQQLYNVADRDLYRDAVAKLEVELQRQVKEVGIAASELPGVKNK